MSQNTLEHYTVKDTIAAIATYPAPSALGVIRISGKRALAVTTSIFSPKKKKNIAEEKTFTLHYGWIKEKTKKKSRKPPRIIDEVIVSIMRGPHSYTGEDVVEISCHGGIVVLNAVLDVLLAHGVRRARPGEFSYRAFLNGRIDLIQAQAIAELIEAQSEHALFSSSKKLHGAFTKEIDELADGVKRLCVALEASVNFPEDHIAINRRKVSLELAQLKNKIEQYLIGDERGRIFKDGLRCVICGKANVGKSTLFNRLLKEERVIVTHTPGTTRDVIEETILIGGIPLHIYDTAGILEPKDIIERHALARSLKALDDADIVLFVFDYGRTLAKDDRMLLDKIKGKNTLFILNKVDCAKKIDINKLKSLKKPIVKMSALKNIGLSRLEEVLARHCCQNGTRHAHDAVFLSRWQRDILETIASDIAEASHFIKDRHSIDFVMFSLHQIVKKMSQLKGEAIHEEVLHDIFSTFCIGK